MTGLEDFKSVADELLADLKADEAFNNRIALRAKVYARPVRKTHYGLVAGAAGALCCAVCVMCVAMFGFGAQNSNAPHLAAADSGNLPAYNRQVDTVSSKQNGAEYESAVSAVKPMMLPGGAALTQGENGLWGLCDAQGQWLVPCMYTSAYIEGNTAYFQSDEGLATYQTLLTQP